MAENPPPPGSCDPGPRLPLGALSPQPGPPPVLRRVDALLCLAQGDPHIPKQLFAHLAVRTDGRRRGGWAVTLSLLCPSLAVSLSLASSFLSLGRFSEDEPMALTSESPEWGKRGVQTRDRGRAQRSPETRGWTGQSTTPGMQNRETGHRPGAWPRVWGRRRGRDCAHSVRGRQGTD